MARMKDDSHSSVGQFDPSVDGTIERGGPGVHGTSADVFGDDKNHQVGHIHNDTLRAVLSLTLYSSQIKYRTLTWPLVAVLMITEIVTYGTLSLPSALAVVGIVPGVILILFLGIFALYTSLVLIRFKNNHLEGMSNKTRKPV